MQYICLSSGTFKNPSGLVPVSFSLSEEGLLSLFCANFSYGNPFVIYNFQVIYVECADFAVIDFRCVTNLKSWTLLSTCSKLNFCQLSGTYTADLSDEIHRNPDREIYTSCKPCEAAGTWRVLPIFGRTNLVPLRAKPSASVFAMVYISFWVLLFLLRFVLSFPLLCITMV